MGHTLITDGQSFRLDATRSPVLMLTILVEAMDEAQLARSLEAVDALVTPRPATYSLVLDDPHAGNLGAAQRRMLARHIEVRSQHMRHYCRGIACVFASPLVRGAVTAGLWLKRPELPTRVFAELHEAMDWAGLLHVSSVLEGRISLRP